MQNLCYPMVLGENESMQGLRFFADPWRYFCCKAIHYGQTMSTDFLGDFPAELKASTYKVIEPPGLS